MATREEVLTLAERLAKHEHFSPHWLTYPAWAGSTKDARPRLEQAKKFKDWAKAILEETLPPPKWLAEEDPAFRDPELNKPVKNPNRLPKAICRRIERKKFQCRIRLETPLPISDKLPKPKRPPTGEEILDLAMRLSPPDCIPEFMFRYPKWASYPNEYAPAFKLIKELKAQAERILKGEERPPVWLVKREPERWTPKQEVKSAPAPQNLADAAGNLGRRRYPLLAGWILRAASPPRSPPGPPRPPPQKHLPPPHPPPQRENRRQPPRTKEVLLLEASTL